MAWKARATRFNACAAGLMALAAAGEARAEIALTLTPPARARIDSPAERAEKIARIPGNASFIDDEAWRHQRGTTIKDITDFVPGVIAQPRNGAESARLSIRGSGLANIFQGRGLLVLQDGIPINMADGEFEFPAIDPWLVRFAEVYPGANALEFGSSNFGGAINLLTPTGITGEGNELRAEAGSFGTRHGQAAAGRAWEESDAFGAATGFAQEGFRDHNQQETGRFNGNAGWKTGEHAAHRVYIGHTTSDAEIPGALSRRELERDPRAANPANLAGDYRRDLDITRIAAKSAWQDGPDRLESTAYYAYRTLDNPVTTYEFQTDHDAGLRLNYARDVGDDRWVAGANAAYGTADESRFRNVRGRTGARILERRLDAFTGEAYGQYDRRVVGDLHGIAGVQASYATRDITQDFPTEDAQGRDYAGVSPRIGMRYDLAGEQQLFANLSRSFEPPTRNELSGGNAPGFADLDAQRATTAEIGARGRAGGLAWQAAYYHGWLTDEFVNYRFDDGSSDTINAGRTTRDGIELGAAGDAARDVLAAGDALALRLAYSYSRFRLDDDPLYGDNRLPGVPEHFLRAELLYRTPSGFSFGPHVEAAPRASPVDLTNTVFTDRYALLGFRAFWKSEEGDRDLYIEAKNLLDANYIATNNVIPDAAGRDGRYFFPGEGRAFYAGLRWVF